MSDQPSARALLPLAVFLLLFFGAGLFFTLGGDDMGFYRLHAPVAMLPAIALALLLGRRMPKRPTDVLLAGMGDPGIMLMCLIFLLAGAFATVTRHVGGVDAAVALGLAVLPPAFVLPGLFAISGVIALAMGTSMGTIAALAPVAVGLAQAAGLGLAPAVASVVGGAMFGDNLSVISDTTIAAARTQGAAMRDKFRENVWIALPAAVITLVWLALLPGGHDAAPVPDASAWLALPYLLVLVLAVAGVDVLVVLCLGLVLAAVLGWMNGADYTLLDTVDDIWDGFASMFEITLLSLLVGGLAALMREQGGLAWLARMIMRLGGRRAGQRAGAAGIAALGAATDVFTANNTVAILISGPVARNLAEHHGIRPGRAASLLDIFSCVMQGVLPYGAQVLLAASVAGLTPLAVAGRVQYVWVLATVTVVAIVGGWPRRHGCVAATRDQA